jgi:hypothetical protein
VRRWQAAALITHLFAGYEAAEDPHFHEWIRHYHDQVDDEVEHFTLECLRALSLRKYTNLVHEGKWAKPSANDEKIIAMAANQAKLIARNAANKNKGKNMANNKFQRAKGVKNKPKQPFNKRDNKYKLDTWKLQALAAGTPKTKTVNGKTYHWCTNHQGDKGQWVLHKLEEECSTGKFKVGAARPKAPTPATGTNDQVQAYAILMDHPSSDDSSDSLEDKE